MPKEQLRIMHIAVEVQIEGNTCILSFSSFEQDHCMFVKLSP